MHSLIRWLVAASSMAFIHGTTKAFADGLENGDFSKGKAKWTGEGQVVFLKPDGSISPTDDSKSDSALKPADPGAAGQKPKNTPIMEIKLRTGQFADLSQKFRTGKGAGALNVEVVYKGSPDFKLNDKATGFTKGITWGPGSFWYWSAVVYPKVDLCMRLDKRDGHCYRLEAVKPGEEWQSAKFRWENVGENQDVNFLIVAPPGKGSQWVKSVGIAW